MKTHSCTNITKKHDEEHSVMEIRAAIPAEKLDSYRGKALERLKREASMDGFRKGRVPEEILIKNLGEGRILQEAADIAVSEELPLLLAAEEVPGIAAPKVAVTKLAPGNPLEFVATIEVLPKIELPDYKKIAAKTNSGKETVVVEEKEIQDILLHLRRERAKIELMEKGEKAEEAAEKVKTFEEKDLPPVDDEFVKGLGYESAEQFTIKLRENVKSDKEARAKDAHRVALIDAIVDTVKVGIPHSLVDHEVHKMEAQFSEDLARANMTMDDYLKSIGKTHEDIHKEWHEPAEKRAKVQLILGDIAVKEDIKADAEEVQKYVEHTIKHHKDISEERARAYYEHMLRNEEVIRWLEEQK